jgi:hypothetical protein
MHFAHDKSMDYFLNTPVGSSLSTKRIKAALTGARISYATSHHKLDWVEMILFVQ